MKGKYVVICVFFVALVVSLLNAQHRNKRQPNGVRFQAIERGDEWLRFYETPEGYVVRQGADGFYYYADINRDGEFGLTDRRAGIDSPGNVALRPYKNPVVRAALIRKIEAFNTAAAANRERFLEKQRTALGRQARGNKKSNVAMLSGGTGLTLEVGVLLVEFNDVEHHGGGSGYTVAEFDSMLFSDDYYHTTQNQVESPDAEDVFGSLRDYFEFQSHGCLTITGEVINSDNNGQPVWLNLGNSSTYAPGGYFDIQDLVPDAINAAIDSSWEVNHDMTAIILAQDPFAQNVGFEWGYAYFQSHATFGFDQGDFDQSFDL